MKKLKFLLLALAATISLGAWALEKASIDDGIYYLYDSASKMYMSRGQNYRARCVVDNSGIGFNVTTIDGQTTISLPNYTNNTIFNANGTVYCDNTSNNKWEIDSYGTGYVIKDLNNNGNNGQFLTINGDKQLTFTSDVASATVWAFQTYSEREATLSANKLASSIAALRTAGSTIASDATVEDFTTELATNWMAKNVTSSLPEQGTVIAEKYNSEYYNAGTPDYNIVKWNMSGLANGLYKITVTASYRMANNTNSYTAYINNQDYQLVNFYANNEKFRVAPLFSEGFDSNLSSQCVQQANGKWYPNGTASCATAFDNGSYKNELYVYISDGNLEYGFNGMNLFEANWLCYKNFTLTYYSNTVSEEDATAILGSVPTGKMASSVSTALNSAKENFIANKNVANYNALATAIANANASIADYAKLKAAIDLAKEYTVVDETYETLATTITTAEGIYNNGTVETCAETIADLDEAVKAAKVADYTYVSNKYLYSVNLGTWNETDGVSEFSNEHWSGETHSYKNQDDSNGRGWNNPTGFEIGLNQNVTLPAGNYVFKACGRKSDLATLELIVKVKDGDELGRVSDFPSSNNAKGIDKDGVTSFEGDNFAHNGNGFGWQWRFVEFELNEETTINVAVSASATTKYQWVSFGDYSVLTDSESNIAMIAYNIALNDANLAIANDKYKNVTGAEKTKLTDAINATPGSTKDEIEAATTALKTATENFVNAAPAYDNYVAILAKVENLDEAGKAKFAELTAEIKAKYDNHTIIASDFEGINTGFIAAVKAQTTIGSDWSGLIVNSSFEETTDVWNNGWETDRNTTGNFDYKLFEESASGITDGKYVLNAWASQINYIRVSQSINLPVGVYELSAAVYSDLVKDQHIEAIVNDNHYKSAIVNNNKWEILSTQFIVSEEGDVTIGIYSNGNNKDGDHFGWFRVDNFKLKYCGPVKSANMTITDANWGTFCAPFDVTIPEGVKAYTAAEGNPVTFTEVTTTIPAGTPVVVYSAAAVNKEFNGKATKTEETCTSGALVGVYAAKSDITAAANHTNYVLQSNTQGVGFYKATSAISLKANRCYMTLATSAGAKDCIGLDGAITGINNILNPTDKSAEGIFDLNGRKLATPQKGINIINGVKVIVK